MYKHINAGNVLDLKEILKEMFEKKRIVVCLLIVLTLYLIDPGVGFKMDI